MTEKRVEMSDVVNPNYLDSAERYTDGLITWFSKQWPDREILGVDNYSTPEEGRSSEIVMFDLHWREGGQQASDHFALRIEPPYEPLYPRFSNQYLYSVELEYGVQTAVAEHSRCPIAPMAGFEKDTSYFERPFYMMQCVEGRVAPTNGPILDSFLVHEATPEQRERYVYSGLDALAEIHRMDWQQAGLQWMLPSGSQGLSMQEDLEIFYQAMQKALKGREHPGFEEIWRWLIGHMPDKTHTGVVWGDARPGNIIVDTDYQAVAVLDWELASICATEIDLGWWLFMDTMNHELEGGERLPGYPTREQQISYYESQVGHKVEDPMFWQLYSTMRVNYIFTIMNDRMQAAGIIPQGDDSFMLNNVGTDFARRFKPD